MTNTNSIFSNESHCDDSDSESTYYSKKTKKKSFNLIEKIFKFNFDNKILILGFGIMISILLSFLMDIVELLTYLILPIIESLNYLSNETYPIQSDNKINLLLAKNIMGNLFYVIINIPLLSSFFKYTFIIRMILFVFYLGSDINLNIIPFLGINTSFLNLIINFAKDNKNEISKLNTNVKNTMNSIESFTNETITNKNISKFIKFIVNTDTEDIIEDILKTDNDKLFKYLNKYKVNIIKYILSNDSHNINKILTKILKRLLD